MADPQSSFDDLSNNASMHGVDPFRSASDQPKRTPAPEPHNANPAVHLIRQKIASIYGDEPAAKQEIVEAETAPKLSRHQQFIMDLSRSGRSLAEIQRAWHRYYEELPDHEKHEVWQEFYSASARLRQGPQVIPTYSSQTEVVNQKLDYESMAEPEQGVIREPRHVAASHHRKPVRHRKPEFLQQPAETHAPVTASFHEPAPNQAVQGAASWADTHRSANDIKQQLRRRVSSRSAAADRSKLTARHHAQSLLFGLGTGAVAIVIVMFSFFNQAFIAPFIQPSRSVSATPLIIGADSIAPTSGPEVIIPKINVEIPLVGFNLATTDENQIENSLEDGVVHYPTTVLPGQKGNAAFFGHSSNNIFNPGHYKFAFALLHDLVPGDTFYLTYGGKVYAYQVYDKQIVAPSDVAVLNNVPGKVATATLITCDPPGTSLNRLVVWGEQVSPDPNGNAKGSNSSADITTSTQLPNNGPSLWSRLIHSIF